MRIKAWKLFPKQRHHQNSHMPLQKLLRSSLIKSFASFNLSSKRFLNTDFQNVYASAAVGKDAQTRQGEIDYYRKLPNPNHETLFWLNVVEARHPEHVQRLIARYGDINALKTARDMDLTVAHHWRNDRNTIRHEFCSKIFFALADGAYGRQTDLANFYIVYQLLRSTTLRPAAFTDYVKRIEASTDIQAIALTAQLERNRQNWSRARSRYQTAIQEYQKPDAWRSIQYSSFTMPVMTRGEVRFKYAEFLIENGNDDGDGQEEYIPLLISAAFQDHHLEACLQLVRILPESNSFDGRLYHDLLVKLAVSGFYEAAYDLGKLYISDDEFVKLPMDLRQQIESPEVLSPILDFIPSIYSKLFTPTKKDIASGHSHDVSARQLKALDWFKYASAGGYVPAGLLGSNLARELNLSIDYAYLMHQLGLSWTTTSLTYPQMLALEGGRTFSENPDSNIVRYVDGPKPTNATKSSLLKRGEESLLKLFNELSTQPPMKDDIFSGGVRQHSKRMHNNLQFLLQQVNII
jgi:hypothetical protein